MNLFLYKTAYQVRIRMRLSQQLIAVNNHSIVQCQSDFPCKQKDEEPRVDKNQSLLENNSSQSPYICDGYCNRCIKCNSTAMPTLSKTVRTLKISSQEAYISRRTNFEIQEKKIKEEKNNYIVQQVNSEHIYTELD